jgi:predicted TIM-barrel fold metal-dependent hydrolase
VTRLIDVHHHATTEALSSRQRSAGIPRFAGMPAWDPAIAVGIMDSLGVTASVLSVPADITWVPEAERPAAARDVNEELAGIVSSAPHRFGAFAMLPLPSPDHALEEAGYALDTLGLDGICMLTSYDGVYLTDPRFTGLLEELDRRAAVVFVHPILLKEPVAGLSPALLEGTFDTTRFATKLAADRVLERFPGIRFILPHTGGMVPYIKWRIALNVLQQGDFRRPVTREEIDREISNLDGLYYDTTLNLGPIHALARPDRILFGTDVPWANADVPRLQRDDLIAQATGTGSLDAVTHGTALSLFPSLAGRLA